MVPTFLQVSETSLQTRRWAPLTAGGCGGVELRPGAGRVDKHIWEAYLRILLWPRQDRPYSVCGWPNWTL